jgi:hypothetical protein
LTDRYARDQVAAATVREAAAFRAIDQDLHSIQRLSVRFVDDGARQCSGLCRCRNGECQSRDRRGQYLRDPTTE